MAKEEDRSPCVISGTQLIERSKNRKIITGTISADIGLGGIPLGSTIVVGGKPKSGKTTTVLQYASNAQNQFNSEIFFFNIEGRIDGKVLSQIQGLNLEKFNVIMGPEIRDKSGEILGHKKLSGQEWWAKAGEIITTKPKSVIIIDSVSALSEEAELTSGMGFFSRGGAQKWEAQFARQYGDLIMPNNITLFLLCQVQANTSGYGPPLAMKLGNSLRHLADAIIFIKGVEKWKPTAEGRVLGQDMLWTIECSPLGCPYIETKIPICFGFGIDFITDTINHCVNWDIIKAKSSWFQIPFSESDKGKFKWTDDIDKEGHKIQGEAGLRSFFAKNEPLFKILDKKIREKIFI